LQGHRSSDGELSAEEVHGLSKCGFAARFALLAAAEGIITWGGWHSGQKTSGP
jgi:hypothetical protein